MDSRRYVIEISAGILLYVLLLAVSVIILSHQLVASAWRVPVSLLPMLAGLVVARAVVRQMSRLDEMQRKLQFDAVGMAFVGTAVVSLSYGFLEQVGFPRLSMFVVWPIMAMLWIAGSIMSYWRLRG